MSLADPTPRAWHMLSDALATVSDELWPALAAGSVGDRAGAEFSAFARRALLAPALEDIAEGRAVVPEDPDLIYFLGASCLGRLGSKREEDGLVAARALDALGKRSMEVAVWTVDAALRRPRKTKAASAFEHHLRGSGSQVLADVLRLGRIPWLLDRDVVYWGDLDTDGFVILDRLRGQLPHVRSVLMDLDTLRAHESQWTTDPTPSRAILERLTPDEAAAHRVLRDNELGTSLRLEQERVNYPRIVDALEAVWTAPVTGLRASLSAAPAKPLTSR